MKKGELVFSLQQMSEILSALPEPVFVLTRTGRYAAIFGGADSRYYPDAGKFLGKSVREILKVTKADWFIKEINKALDMSNLQIVEYNLAGNDYMGCAENEANRVTWFEGRIQPLNFQVDGEDAVLWVASDITTRYKLEKDLGLPSRSETDVLTGLWNHRHFEQAVAQELKRAIRLRSAISLLMLDIDSFKLIMNTHGYKFADSVLTDIASLIDGHTRESDVLFRWHGEKFTLLMPYTDLDGARIVAEKLSELIETHIFEGGTKITVSIGYTQWYFAREPIEQFVLKAEKALAHVKSQHGKGIAHF